MPRHDGGMDAPAPAAPDDTRVPAKRRLFVGLMTGPPVRDAVLAWRERWQWPRGTALSSPAHLHLTLHFLGDTDEALVEPLRQSLARVPFEPFWLRLGRPESSPRGLVVLRPDPHPRLDALHQQVRVAVQSVGIDAGRELAWKPHLTLARKAPQAVPPPDGLEIEWAVNAFSLVWSRLPPQVPKARYEELGRWAESG